MSSAFSAKLLQNAKHEAIAEQKRRAAEQQEKDAAAAPKPHPMPFREEDVFTAWEIMSPAGHSVLTKSQVLDNLRLLFPNMTAREVKDLVGVGNMSVDKLKNLLFKYEMPRYDPNVEAFRILDPHGTGSVDVSVLRHLLLKLPGIDTLDEADMQLIMQLADTDKDGRISLQDFAAVGSWAPEKETATPGAKKILTERQLKERTR